MTLNGFKRWLYRGHRPNWIARILNRAWAAIFSSGITPDYLFDGQQYLVSMLGNDAQWVQNVRAAGGRAVLRCGGSKEIQLEELPADRRAPILRAYCSERREHDRMCQ